MLKLHNVEFQEVLNRIVKKIAKNINPEKIILFGSYAWGNPDKNSDFDILIVADIKGKRWEKVAYVASFLSEETEIMPMDIIVYTPEEFESIKKHNTSFIRKIISKGKILYERKDERLVGIR